MNPKDLTPEIAVKLYAKLGSINEVAKVLGVNFHTVQNRLNTANVDVKDEELLNRLLEKVKDLDVTPFSVKHRVRKSGQFSEEHAVILISDIHFGAVVDKDDVFGTLSYNPKEAWRRAETFTAAYESIFSLLRKAYKFPVLHIILLGDLVDGEALWEGKPNWATAISLGAGDQVVEGVNLIGSLISRFAEDFPDVRVYGMYGNHGRMANKATQRANLDYIIAHMLKLKFQTTHVKVFPMKSYISVFKINEKVVFASHGDETRAWNGFPMYGVVRDTLKEMGLVRKVPDLVVKAHFHNSHSFAISQSDVLVNGSWIGPTLYSVKTMKAMEVPVQWMFGVHPKFGKTWSYTARLAEIPELTADKEGIFTPYE